MSPIRVLHLINVLDIGGMEAGVIKLVNGADPARVQAGICSFSRASDVKRHLNNSVPLFEFARRNGNDPGLVARLCRLFARERPDIIHTHSWGTLCEGMIAARIAGIRKVVHGEHGTIEMRARNRIVQRLVWRHADRVLSVSDRLADRMAREFSFPRERIQTIRNGVDLDLCGSGNRAATRAQLHVDSNELLVVAVGRLVPVKNHAMLLGAIAWLRNQGIRCRLIIAGGGPLRYELEEERRKLGISAAVDLLGARDDVPDLLAACDIFVLSSNSEGMSNTILEAMAAARPVVATDVGGNPELVVHGRTGLLVERGNVLAMAEGIGKIASDRRRGEQMGIEGRRRVELEFGLPKMLHDYEQMYVEVATGRSLVAPGVTLADSAVATLSNGRDRAHRRQHSIIPREK